MGFIHRVVEGLSDIKPTAKPSSLITQIKDNLKSLLNTNPNDCIGLEMLGLSEVSKSSLEKNQFFALMGQEILGIIARYEPRIRVLSLHYDDSLSPWKFCFYLNCCLRADRFSEFELQIDFFNNRYCEVR